MALYGVFREPLGKIVFSGAGKGNAPYSVPRRTQSHLAFPQSSFFTYPYDHESRSHVSALDAYDEAWFQRRRHTTELRSVGGDVESGHILGKDLAVAVQAPKAYRQWYIQPMLASFEHQINLKSEDRLPGIEIVGRGHHFSNPRIFKIVPISLERKTITDFHFGRGNGAEYGNKLDECITMNYYNPFTAIFDKDGSCRKDSCLCQS